MYTKTEKSKALVTYNENGVAEDFEDVTVIAKIKKRHFKKGGFYTVSFEFDDLVLERDYGKQEFKLLAVLKRRLDYNNRIKSFKQRTLAEEAGTDRSNISRTMKTLIADGIIYKKDEDYYFSDKYIKGAGDKKTRTDKR